MTMSFAAALRDPALLGAAFRAASFAPWHIVAKVISGEPLSRSEVALFKRCTGRSRVPKDPVRRLYLLIGRRGGKSRFLSALACWVAALAADWRSLLSAGERGVVLLLGTDKRQAAVLRRYCAGLLETPLLAGEVVRATEDEIEFRSGAVIEVGTNDHRLVRSRTCLAVIGDESCFWRADGEGANSDEEVVAAAEPGMATVPGGGFLILSSSPSRPRGLMHRRWRELYGNERASDLVWVAPSRTMNPALPAAVVTRALAEDPVRARSEYLAEWRSTDADFVPDDVIQACTDWRIRERPPESGVRYFAFTDAAGGTGADSFTMGIAHAGPGETVVLDILRERKPRFVPKAVVAEFAETLRLFRCTEVQGDHFSGGWVRDEFARAGVRYVPSRRTRSEIYLAALPLLLSGRAKLLDSAPLRQQLAGLERRVHAAGRESIDHGGGAGAHDDLANAAMGALVLAGVRPAFADADRAHGSAGAPLVFGSGPRRGLDDHADWEAERDEIRLLNAGGMQ
jgi:hypothetical protein